MEEKKYSMIDNGAGLCAGIAAYQITRHLPIMNATYLASGGFVRIGCQLIEAFVGIEVGKRVRDKVYDIRTKTEVLRNKS